MGRCFAHVAVIALLAAECMLMGCAVKPAPTASAAVADELAASPPPLDAAAADLKPQELIESVPTEAPMLPTAAPATNGFVSDPASRQLLRWKLSLADVIRYETSFVENLTIGDQEFRNERTVRFRWTVFDVNSDGMASILVAFERVRLKLQYPQFSFDSDDERSDIEPIADAIIQRERQAAWSLLDSEPVLKANPRGEGSIILRAEAVNEVWQASHFTPAVFFALPEEPVGPNDSWRVSVADDESGPRHASDTICFLKGDQSVGGCTVTIIECRSAVAPVVAINRFDAAAGWFLSRTMKGTTTMKTGAGQDIQNNFEVKQQLLPGGASKERSLQELVARRYSQVTEFPLEVRDPNLPVTTERKGSLSRPPYPIQQAGSTNTTGTEKSPRTRRGPVER